MFSSIFGNGTSRNLTASLGAGSATASSFSLDTVVTDIATAHAPCSTLALSTASQFLEDKLRGNSTSRNNNRLRTEFAALEALQAKHYNTRYDYTVAVAATEMELNRYVDVLPYEHTRIKLVNTLNSTATSPTIGSPSGSSSFRALLRRKNSGSKVQVVKEQLATYINASSITCSLDPLLPPRGVESHTMNPSWRYIVAQGPLSSTCSTFWEMIVQEKVQSVVMLTDIIENKRKKCHQYFPLNAETTLEIAPEVKIYTRSVTELIPGLVLRKLEVIKYGSIENNYVCDHYHYTGWPDHGVPQSAAPLLLLSYMLRTGSGGGGSGNESPIAVHCSAGIGRSGVFCVVDIAARRLVGAASSVAARRGIETAGGGDPASSSSAAVVLAAQKAVNVGEIVAELRTQRAGMVQTTEQFVFCHAALLELTRAAVAKIS
ncbi:hypothetical protein KSW81_001107 [Nannochloris sp. 'desiccata']|nr:hypothetical protein KSW81_001107 [Chlorella desiccata (nom. nud.)]